MLSRIESDSAPAPVPIAVVTRSMTKPNEDDLDQAGTAARYGLKPAEVRRLQVAEFEKEIESAMYDEDSNYTYEGTILRSASVPYKGAPDLERIVLPKELRMQVIENAHERGGHMSVFKTMHRIIEHFVWPVMRADVRSFINKCAICVTYKKVTNRVRMQDVELPHTPMQMVGMDLIGPFEPDPYGRQYLLTVIDYLSGWAEAYLMGVDVSINSDDSSDSSLTTPLASSNVFPCA